MKASWTLPWPPTLTNRLYRVGRGHVHMDAAARDWKMAAALTVRESGEGLAFRNRARLSLSIFEHPPKGFHGDTDGLIKLVQDALFLGLGANDYWVVDVHAYRGVPSGEGRIDVTLGLAGWRSLDEVRDDA